MSEPHTIPFADTVEIKNNYQSGYGGSITLSRQHITQTTPITIQREQVFWAPLTPSKIAEPVGYM